MQTVKLKLSASTVQDKLRWEYSIWGYFFNWVGPRYWIYTRSIDAFFTLRRSTKIVSSITDLQSCEPGQGSTRCDFVLQRWPKTISSPSDSCWGAPLLACNQRSLSFLYFRFFDLFPTQTHLPSVSWSIAILEFVCFRCTMLHVCQLVMRDKYILCCCSDILRGDDLCAPACPSQSLMSLRSATLSRCFKTLDQVDLTVEEALGKTMKDFYA